ncbi:MAG: DNA polymerase elongation subunit (family B), partial [Thermoplasmata archaeon]
MGKNLLGISPEYAYIHREGAVLLEEIHSPHFLAFCPSDKDVNLEREKLMERWKKGEGLLKHITEIGKVEKFKSFWDFEKEIDAFRVYVKRSFLVPEVSDYLFFNMDLYTAEHDIPYHQRVLIDMASQDRMWVLDTEGREERLKVLVYDIETTEFEEEKADLPIDILGYTSFEVRIKSKKDLDNEDFYFDMEKPSVSWKESEVVQLVSRNRDEEIENLVNFCKILREHDIVSGHNIVGFDNRQ